MNTLLRFLYYIITRLTTLAIIAILIILAIFIGFDWANINVIVNEGLAQRTETVLMDKETTALSKFYTQEFLDRDPLLSRDPYKDYTINSYDHRVKLRKLWVWPWEKEAKMVVEEIVTHIEGTSKDEEDKEVSIPPWENGEKIVIVEKDGRWRIANIILTKPIEPESEGKNETEKEE